MGPEEHPKYPPEWFIVGLPRPRWLPRPPRWRRRYLLAAPILVIALLVIWYGHWGWRLFYTNQTPSTVGGDAAVAIATDHTTYLGDEPLAITVTNHLPVLIYTQTTPYYGSTDIPCDIDLYTEVLDRAGRWVPGWTLGSGCGPPCGGTVPKTPPPLRVLAIAPGSSYTQRWSSSSYGPPNAPGTYRIVFRYSTDSAAATLTRMGAAEMPRGDVPGVAALATATSVPVHVVDDGLHPAPAHCSAA
ncbi:MAG TPA: hypothetical protein VF510_07575 [Ktedonobacterales bacterium]